VDTVATAVLGLIERLVRGLDQGIAGFVQRVGGDTDRWL